MVAADRFIRKPGGFLRVAVAVNRRWKRPPDSPPSAKRGFTLWTVSTQPCVTARAIRPPVTELVRVRRNR